MKSLDSWSNLPPDLPYGSNLGHKIADFVFLPYISFILAFRALECIKRYWSICLFIWGFTSLSTLYRSYHDG